MNLDVDTVWSIVLLVLRWVFIGLIYLILWRILKGVRQEMSRRLSTDARQVVAAPGRLRVLETAGGSGLQAGMIVTLQPETSVGANRSNDLVIHDPYVSRQHARLRWDGVSWWLQDLGSRNGTYLNEQPCPAHQPCQVPFGARLRLGDEVFELLP